MKLPTSEEKFPKNTSGHHYQFSRVVFGAKSKALDFLINKAKQSPDKFHEKCIAAESQMVMLLGRIDRGETNAI